MDSKFKFKKNDSYFTVDVPIGTIVMWGGINNVPEGWLLCDGRVYEQSTYPNLWKIIVHNFGNPASSDSFDPATQFFIPDLRGRFIRGVDDTQEGRDPDRESRVDSQSGAKVGQHVGSYQDEEFKSHTHRNEPSTAVRGELVETSSIAGLQPFGNTFTSGAGGSETRPCNIYLYFIIRAL